jgi:hypothetical protein
MQFTLDKVSKFFLVRYCVFILIKIKLIGANSEK